jgi:hypothetical protein
LNDLVDDANHAGRKDLIVAAELIDEVLSRYTGHPDETSQEVNIWR